MDVRPLLAGTCRLADRGVIRAHGSEAGTFLQGQLTNDVLGLDAAHARLAGFCSAKGRLQASFIVWRRDADTFDLVCAKDLLAATLKRLSMFVLRAKCKLSDASDEIALHGVAGAPAAAWIGDASVWERRAGAGAAVIRLPDAAGVARCLVASAAGPGATVAAAADGSAASLSTETWRWLEVESGIVTIEAATVDRFVPQMVNFELVGGVDFQKGCYPGQEVVARSQYRGTTKRRTFLFDAATLPAAGADVFAADSPGEAAGTVANAASRPDGGGASALVELRLAALGAELRLGAADGPPLVRRDLPYSVPLEALAAG